MPQKTIYVSQPELWDRVVSYSKRQGTPVSQILMYALHEYMEKYGPTEDTCECCGQKLKVE